MYNILNNIFNLIQEVGLIGQTSVGIPSSIPRTRPISSLPKVRRFLRPRSMVNIAKQTKLQQTQKSLSDKLALNKERQDVARKEASMLAAKQNPLNQIRA